MAWLTEILFRRILNWAGKTFGKKGHTGLAVLLFRAGQQPDDFSHALALWHEGQHDDAEAVLARLLSKTPRHAEANNLMGAIYLRRGQGIEAEPFIRSALAFRENYAAAQNNLGNVFLARNALHEAADCYRAALLSDANYAEALTNLGGVLTSLGNYSEAEQFCRRAIQVAPEYAGAYCNLGSVLLSLGRGGEAIAAYRKALELVPDLPEALINLSLVLQDPGYLVGVVDYYEARLKKWPGDYQSHLRIAQALQAQDRWDDGRNQIMQALDVRSEAPDALLLLGHNHAHAGDARSAIECYRRVLAQGANSAAHSGIIFNLLYLDELTGDSLREEFENWAEQHAPARIYLPSVTDLDTADRPLRIGYVSKDFALHSVAYFLEPILANHDSGRVFTVCYSTQLQPDVMTSRFQGMVRLWRDVSLMSIDELEQTVRKDRIDILVDLSGHTSGHRLELFARRPAPVQVTYLGHPSTTGLSTIDYRIGDAITDPPGMTEAHYTEQLWHLPGCFLTYRPPEGNLEPTPAPCLRNRYITFGSFNNALKITDEVLAVWAKILLAVPDSRIVLKSYAFSTQPGKDRVLGALLGLGVDGKRIQLMDWLPTGGGHLSVYNNVDIALDPFPYNGTTTTCEALWMGVPVVCLVGNRHSGRVGASLLTTLGLTELLAKTLDEYVEIAVKWATNPGRLVELRESMRGRMLASQLLDHSGFTYRLEEAYRAMWQRHGQARQKNSRPPTSEICLPFGPGLSLYVPDSLEVITRYVLEEQGDWFEDEIEFVRNCLIPGESVIDIGANYGTYALSMAKAVGPEGHVWAFEPANSVATLLQRSAAERGFSWITVIKRAVSSQVGNVGFLESNNSELSQVVSEDPSQAGIKTIPATTLDASRVEFAWPPIGFIKIDAEGQEPEVVLGGRKLLEIDSPLIMAEFKHGNEVNATLIETMANAGYQAYRLVPGLMLLVGVQGEMPADPYQLNLFFCAPGKANTLAARGLLVSDNLVRVIETPSTYEEVLRLHQLSLDPDNSAEDRWAALSAALTGILCLLSRMPSISVAYRLTSARIHADYGLRDHARREFELIVKLLQGGQATLIQGESCLASSESFDHVRCNSDQSAWALATASHWLSNRLAYSSYFAPDQVLTYLCTLQETGYYKDEAERKIQLIRRRRLGNGFICRDSNFLN